MCSLLGCLVWLLGCGPAQEASRPATTSTTATQSLVDEHGTTRTRIAEQDRLTTSSRLITPTQATVGTTETTRTPKALSTATLATTATLRTPHAVVPPLPPLEADPDWAETSDNLFRSAAQRVSVDTATALSALGSEAIRGHGFLNALTAPPDAERLHRDLLWCRHHAWPDKGSTVSRVRAAIAPNEPNRPLIYKLAETEAFAWPGVLDANTVVPNFINMQTLGLLVLARARYDEMTSEERLRDLKAVILFGRRLQGPNATTLPALNGLELRGHALTVLAWLMQHETVPAPRAAELAQFLNRERELGRGAIRRAWEYQLEAARRFNDKVFALLRSELARNPGLQTKLREQLKAQAALPSKPIDNAELLDFISTRTLGKYYARYREAGEAFARRSPGWRASHRGLYEQSIREIYVPWARRIDPFPMGELDEMLFQEDLTEAQSRLLATACAVLGQAGAKNLKSCADYLKQARLPAELGIEPFTEKPYVVTLTRHKLTLAGADRTALIFAGIPAHIIQRHWTNGARPLTISLP